MNVPTCASYRPSTREERHPTGRAKIGFVPNVLEKAAPKSENTVAVVCGPPIMIKFTFPVFETLGFKDENTYILPWKTE
jgi:NAD(P)H-flavin reductase